MCFVEIKIYFVVLSGTIVQEKLFSFQASCTPFHSDQSIFMAFDVQLYLKLVLRISCSQSSSANSRGGYKIDVTYFNPKLRVAF